MEQALHGTTQSRNLFYLEKGLLGGGVGGLSFFFLSLLSKKDMEQLPKAEMLQNSLAIVKLN